MESLYDAILDLDRTFKLEMEILHGCEDLLDASFETKVVGMLPDTNHTVSLSQAFAKLTSMKDDEIFRMSTLKAQRKLACILDVVGNMQAGVGPDASLANGGKFYETLLHRLQFFNTCKDHGLRTSMCWHIVSMVVVLL